MYHRQLIFVLSILATLAGAATAAAGDWPNWRGPNHDGISDETGLRVKWDGPIPLLWEYDVGSAFSSFACVDGKVYTCGTQNRRQVLFCFDAETGRVVWQSPIEPAYSEPQGGDGTRATPAVREGRVYIFGARGRLVCFDAADGREVWSMTYDAMPTWGYSGSVLIEGDLAIVSPGGKHGGLVAHNRTTGEVVWKSGDDIAGYATPYPFTFDGKRYVVGFMGRSGMIAQVQTGREVWNMPWKTDWNVNASSPIFHDGCLFLSSGYRHGSILLRLKTDGDKLSAETVWSGRSLRQKFQSCVLVDGNLYSADEQGIKCVDFKTGEERWTGPRDQHGTVLLAQGHLFVLKQDGELLIAPATPEKFEPTTQAKILGGRCWTTPAIYNGRLYARNLERVVCFDLRE